MPFRIEENRFTFEVSAITSIGTGRVLLGYKSGIIKQYKFVHGVLELVKDYIGDNEKICHLTYLSEEKFISTNESSVFRIWEISSGNCIKVIQTRQVHFNGQVREIDSTAVVSSNLFAISGYCSPAWECFDIWDLDVLDRSIHEGNALGHRVHGMSLATTAEGYLVASANCGNFSVWHVTNTECILMCVGDKSRSYSMAVLSTGYIVTGSHEFEFYKMSDDKEIYKCKTLDNGNVIDELFPVAGYKILNINRSTRYPLKLWNYVSESCEIYWDTRNYNGTYANDFLKHIVLEEESVVLGMGENKLIIHEFPSGAFHFPKNLAEIRKNARILSQAYRTKTGFFGNLPQEVILKILVLTGDNLNENEKKS